MNLRTTHHGERRFSTRLILLLLALPAVLGPVESHALPAFARQTGQNCVACHAGGQFPELTSYGRMFKMTGYTIGKRTIPLAVMGVLDFTKTDNTKSPDRGADFPKDGQVAFQTAGIFLAGKIIDNMGVFAEGGYDFYDHRNRKGKWVGRFVTGNVDLRAADRFIEPDSDFIYGLSLNNSPTVEDPWNSTPTWGYPYLSSAFAISPSTTPLLAGGLSQKTAGMTAYAYWNKLVYAALGGYVTADGAWSFLSQGVPNDERLKLKGASPYWRLALTHAWGANDLMVGLFGLETDLYPDNRHTQGPSSHYRDIGIDAQYQYNLDPHTVTAQVSYIDEKIDWASSLLHNDEVSRKSDSLHQLSLKGTYVYRAKYGGDLAFFDIGGSTDVNLYPGSQLNEDGDLMPIPISGSRANNPGTRGWIAELFWKPIQYVRVGVQYWLYDRFNGSSNNYDGAGRNASDNNTLYLYVWAAY